MKNLAEIFVAFREDIIKAFANAGMMARLLGIFIIIFISLLILEFYYGNNYFNRLQQKATALKTLSETAEIAKKNPELTQIYSQTVAELSSREVQPISMPSYIAIPDSTTFIKFFSGAFLGLILLIYALVRVKEDKSKIMKGALAVGLFFGIVGALLPIIFNPIVNIIGLPIFQILLLLPLGRKRPQQPIAS